VWIYLHSHSIKRIQPPYFLVCQACASWLLTQGPKGGFPGALKFLLWSLQPYQVTDWNPDSFLAVEPGARSPEPKHILHGTQSPAFSSLIIRVPDCIDSWLLPFCVSLCVSTGIKKQNLKRRHNTQGRSQPFWMEGFLMYTVLLA